MSTATAAQLSQRDLEVLSSVYEHRFLSARQIEELHFADHANQQVGARVCRRVLARLTQERLLARLKRRVGGVRAGSVSYVYALGPAGSRLLADGRRRFTEPSSLFLAHTLAVADTRIALVQADCAGTLELVSVEVEPTCWRRFSGTGGAAEFVKPDLYAVTGRGEYEHCWFFEVDLGTESAAAISRKCRAYQAYWRSGREQQTHGTYPLVVWVAQDKARAKRIDKTITGARALKHELFRVTTAEDLIGLVAGGDA